MDWGNWVILLGSISIGGLIGYLMFGRKEKPDITQPTEVTRIIVRGDTPQQQVFEQEDFARMIGWWK